MRVIFALIRKDIEQNIWAYGLGILVFAAGICFVTSQDYHGAHGSDPEGARISHIVWVLNMFMFFSLIVTQRNIGRERLNKTFSRLRSSGVSDAAMLTGKFVVQLGIVLLAFLIFYFSSLLVNAWQGGATLGISGSVLLAIAVGLLVLNALVVWCTTVFDSKIAWATPFIGWFVLLISWMLLGGWLEASKGIDLNALAHEWATTFYVYHMLPVIGLLLIFGIFKLSVALLGRKETLDLHAGSGIDTLSLN